MATCTAPAAITGGTLVTLGPYNDGDIAVFQCNSGYVMAGTAYITCTAASNTWSTSPSCVLSSSNTVTVNDSTSYNFPDWLVYFIAALCGIIALAVLTCLLVCCLQLFGCYGAGGLFGEPRQGCGCCRGNKDRYERRCTIVPRKYEYDDEGRRFHYDDYGRPCYYHHRNRYLRTVKTVTPETQLNGKTSVLTVSEVQVQKKQGFPPAREPENVWKPHANPIRNINTSTK